MLQSELKACQYHAVGKQQDMQTKLSQVIVRQTSLYMRLAKMQLSGCMQARRCGASTLASVLSLHVAEIHFKRHAWPQCKQELSMLTIPPSTGKPDFMSVLCRPDLRLCSLLMLRSFQIGYGWAACQQTQDMQCFGTRQHATCFDCLDGTLAHCCLVICHVSPAKELVVQDCC